MKTPTLALLFLIFSGISLNAQVKIDNILVNQTKTEFVIEYDLLAEENEEYEIKLFLMREGLPSFKYPILNAKGDVGKITYTRGRKKIRYGMVDSYIQFNPEVLDFYFQIEVYETGGGLAWYYYVLGGVVTGGVAAVLLLSSDKSETEAPTTVGAPPIRP